MANVSHEQWIEMGKTNCVSERVRQQHRTMIPLVRGIKLIELAAVMCSLYSYRHNISALSCET